MKRLLMGILLTTPCVYADWVTDLSLMIQDGKLDQEKAVALIQSYISKDEQSIEQLNKKLEIKDEDGFWAGVRGSTYKVQWAAAKANLRYHTRVLEFIKELPKNVQDYKSFVELLTNLKEQEAQLAALNGKYKSCSGLGQTITFACQIKAKELLVQASKVRIKGYLLF